MHASRSFKYLITLPTPVCPFSETLFMQIGLGAGFSMLLVLEFRINEVLNSLLSYFFSFVYFPGVPKSLTSDFLFVFSIIILTFLSYAITLKVSSLSYYYFICFNFYFSMITLPAIYFLCFPPRKINLHAFNVSLPFHFSLFFPPIYININKCLFLFFDSEIIK
ncbi:Uncharacterized protein CTYZ_00000204 [Cryptosporidium tyzzeri]|nr:Uncharacterized protein CTYZ_00000204 [Cryptosporidium tyzzeri]